MTIIITKILICAFIFCVGIWVGVLICTKGTEKQVAKEMWRVCKYCKYRNLQEDDYDNNSREV